MRRRSTGRVVATRGGRGASIGERCAAILAFDLKANGVDLKGRKLDATWAKDIVIHP